MFNSIGSEISADFGLIGHTLNWLLSPVPQQNRLWLTIGLLVTIAMIAGSVVLLVADAVAGAIHGALSKDGRDGRKIKRGH